MHHSKLALIRIISSQWLAVTYAAAVKFFLLVFLARELGPSSLAIFLYIQAIASLFAILQEGGFPALVFREKVASSKEIGLTINDLVSGYFSYIILVTLTGSAIVLLAPTAFKTGFLLAFIYFAFRGITNIVSSLLKGQGSFTREAIWRFQINTFLALPVLILIWFTPPLPEKVFLGFIIGQLFLLTTQNGRKFISRPKLAFPHWRIWKTCFSFMIISGATMLYAKSGVVLLKHLQPDLNIVGYYGAASQFLEGVIILATPIIHLLFRHMRLSWLDRKTFSRRFGKSMIGVIVITVIIITAGIIFAPNIIILVYGKTYNPAADLLPLLLLSLLFILPNFILSQAMIALNGEKYYAFAASLCAVFNVELNLYLIPIYIAKGAALAVVTTEVLLTLLLGGWFVRWYRTGMVAQEISRQGKEEDKSQDYNHVK
ncbi:MAG: polysaccharide biosynthesis C-terminal domain-containing protein [Syntrophaceae bacterium]|nr:polysaccharide biosynthesis C-terminal domain-containing protein [Syntrophaceae bacterium]